MGSSGDHEAFDRSSTAYSRTRSSSRPEVALLAAAQHGTVARQQLLALGLTRDMSQDRITAGRFHRIHRGIYAVDHRKLTLKGHWMAAVLACGPDALLSHRFALAVWEVQAAESGLIEVTVPHGCGRPGPKRVRVHVARALMGVDVAVVDGIPVTSLARTVLDFSSLATVQRTRRVLEKIERMGRLIGRELEDVLERNPRHRGAKRLRTAIAELTGPAPWTQSELEDRFLALIREAGSPRAAVQRLRRRRAGRRALARSEADRRGRRLRLPPLPRAVRDRPPPRREAAGWPGYRVIRLTQRRIDTEPSAVAALFRALARRLAGGLGRALARRQDVGDRARGDLGREPDGLRQRRVGVDRERDVLGVRRPSPSRSTASAISSPASTPTIPAPSTRPRLRLERGASSARPGRPASARGPTPPTGTRRLSCSMPSAFAARLGEARPGDLGVRVGDRRDRDRVVPGAGLARDHLGGDLALVRGLVREHRLADDVADREDVRDVRAQLPRRRG